jgi:hypothetical protein
LTIPGKLRIAISESLSCDNILFFIEHEIKIQNTYWDDFFSKLLTYLKQINVSPQDICVFIDPWSTQNKATSDNLSLRDAIKKRGFTAGSGFGCYFIDSKRRPSREQALESVQRGFAHDKILIHPRCQELIKSLTTFSSLNKTQTTISRDYFGHLCDALKFVVNYFTPSHLFFAPKYQVQNINKNIPLTFQSQGKYIH